MKNLTRIMIAIAVFVSGVALVPFVGMPTTGFRWQQYADAYIPMTLEINHTEGTPGSYFSVFGTNFTPDSQITILVNSLELGQVTSDSTGNFMFIINTFGAEMGNYIVSTNMDTNPYVAFVLEDQGFMHPKEGEGPEFSLPSDIASRLLHLPLIHR